MYETQFIAPSLTSKTERILTFFPGREGLYLPHALFVSEASFRLNNCLIQYTFNY